MDPQTDDQMVLISQYYPVGIINQFAPEQAATENIKPRRRRKKNKGRDGGGGGGDGLMRKRKLSELQVRMLERSFRSEHKLEWERKNQLAAELGMDPRQVVVWFQNRRVRWKSKKLEEEYSRLRSEHESTVVEKCRLETELLKIKEQLHEAEKEIQKLSERWDGLKSNSPIISLSVETNKEPPFLGEFGLDGMNNVLYVLENTYADGLEWDSNIYYM